MQRCAGKAEFGSELSSFFISPHDYIKSKSNTVMARGKIITTDNVITVHSVNTKMLNVGKHFCTGISMFFEFACFVCFLKLSSQGKRILLYSVETLNMCVYLDTFMG